MSLKGDLKRAYRTNGGTHCNAQAASRIRRLRPPDSDTYVILDLEERVIAVLLGRPEDGEDRPLNECWKATAGRVATLFETSRKYGEKHDAFPDKLVHHRRGNFTAVSFGMSYGGGQKVPGMLRHTKARQAVVDRFQRSKDLARFAGHGSRGLSAFFPQPYQHMREGLHDLCQEYPDLKLPFKTSVYPTVTANLGPDTTTLDHNDCTNFPSLACAITPFGNFDADKGGQLYFWDLGLRVRFPAGSTILLSSAGLRHGNLPIQPGEKRYSFTQYCPGGLLRWVRHGMRPAGDLSPEERDRLDGAGGEGWERQLERLSKYSNLQEDREALLRRERELWGGRK
ncbi:hypothetical protein FA95DRAFT_1612970 [Auriscalpium vulgare]|uniref:Uncharacterized protein n=1 Tax=Auriscalpium vulgare TaxID=40419 RepID=A0ACB8R573_9AGAM|nr:hypothetical protein FA95DRAFT_1612970 [Auriscalpium vulgare]